MRMKSVDQCKDWKKEPEFLQLPLHKFKQYSSLLF